MRSGVTGANYRERKDMTPKERVLLTIRGQTPDRVPHFERFELTKELFGRSILTDEEYRSLTPPQKETRLQENVDLLAEVAEYFDYSIVRVWGIGDVEAVEAMVRKLSRIFGHERIVAVTADATFHIPPGSEMMEFCYRLVDAPEEIHADYRRRQNEMREGVSRYVQAGAEAVYMNSDYCCNAGPFLTPRQFSEFVTPYLREQTEIVHREGAIAIKHTDGNIRPILEEMLACGIDILQSLDPQGGIDLAVLKSQVGGRVCLAGNVDCCMLQQGTLEDCVQDARRALGAGKPNNRYIFMSSNSIFEGIPLENYRAVWQVWRQEGMYEKEQVKQTSRSIQCQR
jgi:uroporphyrinogen decarboxylase